MRMRMTGISTLALALVLVGCGGGSEEEQIARDACGLLEDIVEGGPEAMMDEDLMQEFAALEERAQEADIDDAEMEAAMQEECPEVFEALEGMFDVEPVPGD